MTNKMTLLALAVASAALFAAPATAAEVHVEGITNFSGSAPASEIRASGEPTITCESTVITGSFSAGGTTGTYHEDHTGCHINVLGFTVKCRTAGSALDNTVTTAGTFHTITTGDGSAAWLKTPNTTELTCAGTAIITHGEVIGTIISPKCGESSTTIKLSFGASGSAQDHTSYTGKTYNLTSTTSNGTSAVAAVVGSATLTSATAGKLSCT